MSWDVDSYVQSDVYLMRQMQQMQLARCQLSNRCNSRSNGTRRVAPRCGAL